MKALTTGLMAIVLAAATAACDGSPTTASAFAPESDGIAMARQSRLTFSSTQSYDTQTPQTASGTAGAIDFTGSLTTGTPCYDVKASHRTQSNAVTVTVTASSTGGFCTQVITYNNYTGQVSGLSAGTYDFTVVHDVGGSSTTAYTGTVTVQ
ncbi:MAG: hypothetical protein KY467_16720 [Gemmatimonadetes bacterium]|nr:hypothetical protein [Gemmatimonadota bacterium]